MVKLAPCVDYVNLEVAAGAQAGDLAVGPRGGEGGEEVDHTVVALNEKLGNACGAAEVTVDLEWRMEVPHIVGCAILEKVLEQYVSVVAVKQTGPVVEFPAH